MLSNAQVIPDQGFRLEAKLFCLLQEEQLGNIPAHDSALNANAKNQSINARTNRLKHSIYLTVITLSALLKIVQYNLNVQWIYAMTESMSVECSYAVFYAMTGHV